MEGCLGREKREKELADFLNEQDAELNPTSGDYASGAGADRAASEPAPPPIPDFDPLNDPAWGNLGPKGKKERQK